MRRRVHSGPRGPGFCAGLNPGDIVVEREVMPRIAYAPVPKDQDPVTSRVSTFPTNSFNPTMAQVASDADLTNAHGSTGLDRNVAGGAGLQAVTRILTGNATTNNVALNSGGIGQPAPGIGGNLSQSVTGALAPLSTAPGGAPGGLDKWTRSRGVGRQQRAEQQHAASTSTVSKDTHGAMVASSDSTQTAAVAFHGSFESTATLGTGALSHATGNIGVNIAGGAGNVQHNGLAIASLSTSK
ncbi:hypothetical protein [Paraburkholderia sp. LEh10]|uniref:hypothetical protein n=1 Tax=Paraburkholderia sp. LEh10 TaxID=2821353 RepID=UPI001FD80E5C|nr:hypothetical protein [Paraburkholderia sp. LEh10]